MICPKSEECGRKYQIRSVSGMKRHMTKYHGGWEGMDIEAMINERESAPASQPSPAERETLFADDSIPAHETPQKPAPAQERERSTRSRKAQVRMSQAMSGFKEKIAEMLPQISVAFFSGKIGVEGRLSDEAGKTLSEMWSAYLDLLGFDVEAEPLKFKIGGKWLFLTFPVMMLGVTFFMMTDKRKVEVKKPGAKPAPVPIQPIFTPEPPAAEQEKEDEEETEHEPI